MESTRIWADSDSNEARIRIANLDEPIELSVTESRGSVTFTTDESDDVIVRADYGGDADGDGYLHIGYEGNRIEIFPRSAGSARGRDRRQGNERVTDRGSRFKIGPIEIGGLPFGDGGRRGSTWFDIEIVVPRAWMLAAGGSGGRFVVRTASGDIELNGISGQVDALTASGAIQLSNITGHMAVNTASGDVQVTNAQGSLMLRTASGDVEISDSAMTDWTLTAASGDMDVQAALVGAGPYRIQTVNGDIDLVLGYPEAGVLTEERACVLTWQTVSGSAQVESPFRRIDRRVWSFGSPDATSTIPVDARTVSGDLSAAIAAVPAEPGWPDVSAATRQEAGSSQGDPVDPFERGWSRVESEIESALESVDRVVADLESRFGWDLGNVRNLTGHPGRSAAWGEEPAAVEPITAATPEASSSAPFGEAPATSPTSSTAAVPPTPAETPGEEAQPSPTGDKPIENSFPSQMTSGPDEERGTTDVPLLSAGEAVEAEKLHILMALERGEVTVEEAMWRLEELGSDDRSVHAE